MDTKMQLKQIAIEIANDQFERAESLKPELHEKQTRIAIIQAQLDAAKLYHKRLADFVPEINGDFQCPRCWVFHETKTSLRPIPSETKDDYFRCPTCELRIEIEI